jgi:hypothetical protein
MEVFLRIGFLKGDSHQIQVFYVILQIVLAGCVVLFGRPAGGSEHVRRSCEKLRKKSQSANQ